MSRLDGKQCQINVTPKNKHYFDNDACQALILEYQKLYKPLLYKAQLKWDGMSDKERARIKVTRIKEREWIRVEADKSLTPKIIRLREKIIKRLIPVIRGEINTIGFYKFAPIDDIMQEAVIACQNSLPLFNPEKIPEEKRSRAVFNYFSIATKKKLRGYTLKYTKVGNIEIHAGNFTAYNPNQEIYTEDITKEFFEYFEKLFEGKDRFLELLDKLKKYCLEINKSMEFKKKDFKEFAEAWGFSQGYTDKFIAIVRSHSDTFWKKHEG